MIEQQDEDFLVVFSTSFTFGFFSLPAWALAAETGAEGVGVGSFFSFFASGPSSLDELSHLGRPKIEDPSAFSVVLSAGLSSFNVPELLIWISIVLSSYFLIYRVRAYVEPLRWYTFGK